MGHRAWTEQEDAIVRSGIAEGMDYPNVQRELAKWGWTRSIEAVAAHSQILRRKMATEQTDRDVELLHLSIRRRWL